PTLVVAAGGIADGRGLAAALCLGAVGVWCGTAFLATKEAFADVIEHRAEAEWRALVIKQKIVEATEEGTRVSRAITGKPARLIDTPLVQAWERPDAPPTLPMPLQGALMNNLQRRVNLGKRADLATEGMGQIAGMIDEVRPAADVVAQIVEQAGQVLAALSKND
ncbi:MAG: NAD(P)H-dependent flavin oxidoreductase, partial [Acidimicrobiia bacterium]